MSNKKISMNIISVITTVKNGEAFIFETLQSVYNQTHKNYEHIIIDDGSTDKTIKFINEFRESYPDNKIKLFKPGHLGRGKALNYAVSKAKGEWIAIIDADDIWHPKKLQAQVTILTDNPNITVLATKTGLFSESVIFDELSQFTFEVIRPKRMLYKSIISHSSVIIRKEDAVYDTNRTSQYDAELWYRLAFDNKKSLAILHQQLNFHRIHQNQSFESSKGQAYQTNAMKLSIQYCFKTFTLFPIIIYLLKFVYRLIIPRSLRFKKKIS